MKIKNWGVWVSTYDFECWNRGPIKIRPTWRAAYLIGLCGNAVHWFISTQKQENWINHKRNFMQILYQSSHLKQFGPWHKTTISFHLKIHFLHIFLNFLGNLLVFEVIPCSYNTQIYFFAFLSRKIRINMTEISILSLFSIGENMQFSP